MELSKGGKLTGIYILKLMTRGQSLENICFQHFQGGLQFAGSTEPCGYRQLEVTPHSSVTRDPEQRAGCGDSAAARTGLRCALCRGSGSWPWVEASMLLPGKPKSKFWKLRTQERSHWAEEGNLTLSGVALLQCDSSQPRAAVKHLKCVGSE